MWYILQIAPHKHVLKVWFFHIPFTNSWQFLKILFSLTDTKFSNGLAKHSPLSKQLNTRHNFFPFWRARCETWWWAKLSKQISSSDEELYYSENIKELSCAERNINNICTLNVISPLIKGNKTLEPQAQKSVWSGHWETGTSILQWHQQGGSPGAGQKNSGKADRFVAAFLYEFHSSTIK